MVYTLVEASAILNYQITAEGIKKRIQRGYLNAYKKGKTWLLTETELDELKIEFGVKVEE